MTTPDTHTYVTLACVACGWVPRDDAETRIWDLVAHLEEHAGRGEEIAVTAYTGRHRRGEADGPS